MNFMGSKQDSCGCNQCPTIPPTYQQCNQVVQTCNVEDVPHYINYHTHVVNNCIKRHVNVPTYSASSENVLINEYAPMPQMINPYMQTQPYMGMPQMAQYQGNVGVEGINQQMVNPFMNQQFPTMSFPYQY